MRLSIPGALALMLLAGTGAPGFADDPAAAVRLDVLQSDLVRRVSPTVVGLTCSTSIGQDYYGTGMIIHERGWVLTNISVIPPQGTDIKVFCLDGKSYEANIVEYDVKSESILIAMVPKKDETLPQFPYLELADSRQSALGHRVYTFANPFMLQQEQAEVAVSAGAISGIGDLTDNAEERIQSTYTGPVLETDAALNPGSDGGPLTDSAGRLLGIMSLAFQRERLLGACIPVHLAAERMKALREFKLHAPPQLPLSARSQVLGRRATAVRPGVVWLEVDRVAELTFKMPKDEEILEEVRKRGMNPSQAGLLKMQYRLKELMQRPPGFATGIAIDSTHVLTSAFNVSHNRAGRLAAGQGPLIRSITVRAEGLAQPLKARVVSRFLTYDLALLEVIGGTLPNVVKLGSVEGLVEGHSVGVLGRQRGVSTVTMTQGIVSTAGRNHRMIKVFQTDARINYANLGGPVIDLEGRVVGLATFLHPDAQFGINSGVGLFTDAATISKVLPQMKAGKSQARPELPFLGIRGWEEKSIGGAYIASVFNGSSAIRAGVRPGDLIVSIDGKPIGEWSDLIRIITSKRIGQEIEFEVQRAGKKLKLRTTLGRRNQW